MSGGCQRPMSSLKKETIRPFSLSDGYDFPRVLVGIIAS